MTELERPIKELLRGPRVPVDALWQRIERERSRALPRRRVPGFALAVSGAFSLALLVAVYALPHLGMAPMTLWDHGPLRRAGGELLGELDTSDGAAALDVALSDGSHIHLDPGAKLVTRASDAQTFRAELVQGSLVFDVKPHGPRRWILDAGDTRLEVLGTRFRVEHVPAEARIRVAVERGRVSVSGPRVPGGEQVLSRSEQLQLAMRLPDAPQPRDIALAVVQTAPASQPAPAPDPPPRVGATIDDLLRDADAARAARDFARAERLLRRALREYAHDPQASLVALTLGRLQLDQLTAPKAAAASLERAQRLGLPAALAEEGTARLVEAYARAGEPKLARDAAARYRAHFPHGARSASVAAWLTSD